MKKHQKDLEQYIRENESLFFELADQIFSLAEPGLQEFESSRLLQAQLSQAGFQVESGVGQLPTAFRAVFEQPVEATETAESYAIGLLCEYDALEGIGHACAHHLQGPAVILAATVLKKIMEQQKIGGKIVVYGTPAEETVGGKLTMLKNGCFKDIDVALMMHGGPETTTDIQSLALDKIRVRFKGLKAHAAIKPEDGISALDSLLLAFHGIEIMREHVRDDTRIHFNIEPVSCAPANVVPDLAESTVYLRSYSRPYLNQVVRRFEKVIEGAAMMTGAEYEIERLKSLDNKIPVMKLNDLLLKYAQQYDAPNIKPYREKTGSTDFGSVMYQVPGSCIRVAFVPPGTSSHSDTFLDAGKTEAAHHALRLASLILASSALDLLLDPDLANEIRDEFNERKLEALGG